MKSLEHQSLIADSLALAEGYHLMIVESLGLAEGYRLMIAESLGLAEGYHLMIHESLGLTEGYHLMIVESLGLAEGYHLLIVASSLELAVVLALRLAVVEHHWWTERSLVVEKMADFSQTVRLALGLFPVQ